MFGNQFIFTTYTLPYYKKLTPDEIEIRINSSGINVKYKESDVLI